MFRRFVIACLLSGAVLACSGSDGEGEALPVVTDGAGRSIVLPVAPRRIVSLVPVATEILFELGAEDLLVGRSRWDDYPPGVDLIPDVGDAIRPSVERVLMQEPDLVILIGGSDNALAVQEMSRLGVPFVVVLFNTLADLERGIGLLGRIVGRQDRAEALWSRVRAELEAVVASVSDLARPTVYYDVGYPPAFTVGAGSYLDTLIAIAGGRNVFHDLSSPSPQVSLEAILARDPDLIIHPVSEQGVPVSAAPVGRPGWTALRAVRAGNVRHVPAAVVHRLGPRLGVAARELAAAIHPGLAHEDAP